MLVRAQLYQKIENADNPGKVQLIFRTNDGTGAIFNFFVSPQVAAPYVTAAEYDLGAAEIVAQAQT
ncbi:hypothetical protein [uncultured Stenotrophomonas sp.]|uniref:hypothetical protein n=1 Tax=uncultured Stenotrophomonas sp. TaxID=165438 RepID=UPI0025EF2FD8|nr:hypothetical protein [uncultured Stenotrophomonas sp.]